MILGRIIGRTTTNAFSFKVEDTLHTKKFDFVQAMHQSYGFVLCQIVEIIKEKENTLALCNVVGYKDGTIKPIRTPLDPGSEILRAQDDFIKQIIDLAAKDAAFIGTLEGRDAVKVSLDLKKLLTKHIAVLAKTGAGKSYVCGVLIEEIMEKKVPLLIIDPHGEYGQMREPNEEEKKELLQYGLVPKGYSAHIQEYGDIDLCADVKPLLLNEEMTTRELLTILPAKMSSVQQAALYSIMRDSKKLKLTEVVHELEQLEHSQKYNLISMIDYLKNLQLFSANYTPYQELIAPGRCTIINLKGIEPEIQEIIVYKLLKDLFDLRKTSKIAPFFCVLEEAHNFVPERTAGEKISSSLIRTIASEGRKFGLGLCVVTQRPARIEKNVLSQCTTQIILKVTNPNDLKAISSSVEGITTQAEDEIQNLPIGTAIITGISDMPFFVKIRTRKSRHGGGAVDLLQEPEPAESTKHVVDHELLPIIDSKYSIKEIKLMEGNKKNVLTYLIPAVLFTIQQEDEYCVLIEKVKGHLVTDIAKKEMVPLNQTIILRDYQTFERVIYKRVSYDKKIEPKKNTESIRKKLSSFVSIAEEKECYIVYHYSR